MQKFLLIPSITAKIIKLTNGEIVGTFTVSGKGNGINAKKVAMKVINRQSYIYGEGR